MKLGTHIEVKEKPGEIISGVGGDSEPLPGASQKLTPEQIVELRDSLAQNYPSTNPAERHEWLFPGPGAPSAEWIREHMISRPLTKWEKELQVIADDPELLRISVLVMRVMWLAIGFVIGATVTSLLIHR